MQEESDRDLAQPLGLSGLLLACIRGWGHRDENRWHFQGTSSLWTFLPLAPYQAMKQASMKRGSGLDL